MIRCKKIIWLSLATLLYTAPTRSAQANTLLQAARDGNQAAVQSFIAEGVNVNQQDLCGWTPSMAAAAKGHNNVVQLLLQAGANKDLQDSNGWTALIYAMVMDHDNIARLLIDAGANKDLQDSSGSTPLMLAALKGHVPIARLLINAGADPDLQNGSDSTALMIAATKGHELIVQMLLEHGVSLLTESQWAAMLDAQRLSADQIEAVKQLVNENRNIVQRRALAAGEYFEAEGMPPDVVRLIQQIGVEGMPAERARPVPEEE